eukprot:TRINITY_DN2081_c0_g1_i8.p1 TRINITY_DN2081_c0_g1~~TRINITY_DN2081_c0_g1_i8.p1  ORF type:complete len:214 (+),score=-27.92 TRINITY_DN2081_c0_g1_i8:145-786(+)
MLATDSRGCARCGTQPNTSQHELTTAMQHLYSSPEGKRHFCRGLPYVKPWQGFSRIIELNHMLHRLCGPPSIPLSFTLASILPRRCTYRVSFGTDPNGPTPSAHRLRRGLPGYLILFAPHAFAPQRQFIARSSPSPPVFFLISTDFTPTPGILTSPLKLQLASSQRVPPVEPRYFTPSLTGRLRALYAQQIRTTLATYVLPRLLARNQPLLIP